MRFFRFWLNRPDDLECAGAVAVGSETEGFGLVVGISVRGPRRSGGALRMALSSRFRSIGLVKWSKNPASRLCRRSSSAPKPLMAMPAIGSTALISRISCSPSPSGSSMSEIRGRRAARPLRRRPARPRSNRPPPPGGRACGARSKVAERIFIVFNQQDAQVALAEAAGRQRPRLWLFARAPWRWPAGRRPSVPAERSSRVRGRGWTP